MNTLARVRSFLLRVTVLLTFALAASAGPISDSIQVGDRVTGSFRYALSHAPGDTDPLLFSGEYRFTDANSFIQVTIGGHTFSSAVGATFIPSRPGHLSVLVTNRVAAFDFLQIRGIGDEASFAPFLSFFSRQDPAFVPLGTILINFILDPNALFSDALPTVIDPSAAMPFDSFPAIYGQVEGLSTQPPDEAEAAATREWAIFYEVEPRDVSIENNVVSGRFVGRVTELADHTQLLPPNEMFDALLEQVTGVGPGRSLQRKIQHARAYFVASDLTAACAMLSGFSAEVRAQSGKSIPRATANKLSAEAAAVGLAIECDES
ncbi:hypothetical protein GCM10011487_58530 [Steroidobacter agaridevorans]|uniref:Uncharacterized protein n=1 Tax=Steroidobacter agaridevorans TaxID=2695856 RepID=A0A829YLY8_9GAMM|nr:hypothetical protein [Steroidobacter agaridevorans]GFE83853.1 hypothetical protein GCM10011487_58530 [Steroidobacter agaridevorans]GFE91560.1 hypothetical protein GCM10011488_65140 [Steroidobacter agaridevorans]